MEIRSEIIAPFFVLFFLYIKPAVNTKEAPIKKLAISPTPPVDVNNKWIIFLTSTTHKPGIGPNAKDVIIAGISEKSNFKNEGIKGNGTLINIIIKDIAPIIDTVAITLNLELS